MSVTVISSPQTLTPVVNAMNFVVSGTNQNEPNFRYVAEVLNASSGTVATLKCDKLPSNNNGFFDVRKIVETLIVPAIPNAAQTGFVFATDISAIYNIRFKEEFGTTPAITSGFTAASGTAFLGALSQVDFRSYQSSGYIGTAAIGSNYRLLTNRPTTINTTSGGVGYIGGVMNYTGTIQMLVNYFNAQGANTRTYTVSGAVTSGTLTFFRAGIGETNLRNLTSAQCSDGIDGDELFPTSGGYYTVQIRTSDTVIRSATYRVNIGCSTYPKQRVHFRNKWGEWDFFDFTMKNRRSATIERSIFEQNQNIYGTETAQNIYAGSWQDSYALISDYLSDAEYVWLFDLISSPKVYLELNGALIDAVVENTNYSYITRQNDRLVPLQMTIRPAFKNELL